MRATCDPAAARASPGANQAAAALRAIDVRLGTKLTTQNVRLLVRCRVRSGRQMLRLSFLLLTDAVEKVGGEPPSRNN